MYKNLILLIFLATPIIGHAGLDNNLERAAKNGNALEVAAVLKAGANVEARFDIQRTALIIAAMHGHVSVVEELLNAGADMYARDSNHQDALTIAVEHRRPKVVRALLNRGFDPSLDDWRALKMLPSEHKGAQSKRKTEEIRQMLVERKKSGGTATAPPASTRASTTSTTRAGITDDAFNIIIDISGQKVTPELFKNAASRALLRRGWQLTTLEDDRLIGTLARKESIYKAAVVYSPPLIKISYVPGFGAPKPNWLHNINKGSDF